MVLAGFVAKLKLLQVLSRTILLSATEACTHAEMVRRSVEKKSCGMCEVLKHVTHNFYWQIFSVLYLDFLLKLPAPPLAALPVYVTIPVVPHKAVADVSRIGNYRRDWLL